MSSTIWIVFRTGANTKTPATRFSEQLAFFHTRKGLPSAAKKTTKYCDAVVNPVNGDYAFPVNPEDASLIPSSPHQFQQVTESQLISEGFWSDLLNNKTATPVASPLLMTEMLSTDVPAPESAPTPPSFWQRHGWKVAAGAAAAAAIGGVLWHFM